MSRAPEALSDLGSGLIASLKYFSASFAWLNAEATAPLIERGSVVVLDRVAKLKPAVLVVELLQRWLTASC